MFILISTFLNSVWANVTLRKKNETKSQQRKSPATKKNKRKKKLNKRETRNFDGLMKYESDPINKCVRKKRPNSKLIEFLEREFDLHCTKQNTH